MSRKLMSAGALLMLTLALLSPPGHAAATGPSPQGLSDSYLHVKVALEGRPVEPSKRLITKVIYHLTMGTEIHLKDTTATDENGIFKIDVTNLPKGDYYLWVKTPNYLANATQIRLPDALGKPVGMEPLMAGDADGNNAVGAIDFLILKRTFGKTSGQAGYDARADFDGNDVVNAGDFQLMRTNFGIAGVCEPGSALCP
jgi:dockerin type I repeat protein